MTKPTILFLYNYTHFMPRPWAEGGHVCACYDIKHSKPESTFYPALDYTDEKGASVINFHSDLSVEGEVERIVDLCKPGMVFAFPVCTDLSFIGIRHWEEKMAKDRDFIIKAARPAVEIGELCEKLNIPYMIENPKGALEWAWRTADYVFNPYEYGGYLPYDDQNPLSPLIPGRDAYQKRTLLWTSKDFVMPEKKPVEPVGLVTKQGSLMAPQFDQLGGKSEWTKTVRSATPRGFACAVYLANKHLVKEDKDG